MAVGLRGRLEDDAAAGYHFGRVELDGWGRGVPSVISIGEFLLHIWLKQRGEKRGKGRGVGKR